MRVVHLVAVACLLSVSARALAQGEGAGAVEAPKGLKPPKLLKFIEAEYPADKKASGIEAKVVLSIEINEAGKVGEVEVVAGAGADFDAAAVVAVKKFEFEPASMDGNPIPVKIQYAYRFAIKEVVVKLGPQINFEGVVIDKDKKAVVPDVKVKLVDLDVETSTDENGQFAFLDVPPGQHMVELSSKELVTIKTEEVITKGKKRSVKYTVEAKEEDVDEEVVVRAPRIKKEVVETRVRTEEAKRVPGTQGDTLKVVQNLPGVGRSAFGSGALIVWGSAPQESRVVVDGVEIPALYHVGGMRSTVNSDLVSSIDLSPGAYGAEYGRGLGGLVRIEMRDPVREGVHGYVAADVIDVSGMVAAAVTPKLRVAVAGRQGYLDKILQRVVSNSVGDYFPIPRYDDYQARASLTLGKDEELAATFLSSDDYLRRTVPSTDPLEIRTQDTVLHSRRLILRYTRLFADGSSLAITPSFGYDENASTLKFGSTPALLDIVAWQYALRASYRRRVASNTTLSIGIDFQERNHEALRVGSVNLPPREGDIYVFGQPPTSDILIDHWRVNYVAIAPYVSSEITLGKLTLVPGLRLEPTVLDGNLKNPHSDIAPNIGWTRLDTVQNPVPWKSGWGEILRYLPNPRLSAAYKATTRLAFTGGVGVYGQPPQPEELSPVFGNPSLGTSSAVHFTGGTSYRLTGTLGLEVVGFYKKLYDLVARSELPSPPVGQALQQTGIGRSYGGQLLLRQELVKGFFGWLSYSLIRSERRDRPDTAWRLLDYDQTHVLALLASYEIRQGLQAGFRFRYTTGAPRTPVIGSYSNGAVGRDEPIFGAQNSIRLPAFYSLDLRVEKIFVRGRNKLNLFLDVQNVTNRKNPEEIAYSANFSQRDYISGLPILAVVGARMEF
jgi:TonB family protein